MIRIGVVNIDVSHPKAFSEYLAKMDRARYVAVYNDGFRGDDEVEAFMQRFNLQKRCSSIEELADFVDIGFVQSCNWDNHLKQAMPFIERGKPVFIDKPIAGSLTDCRKLEQLVSKGAVILGCSSLRYAEEVVDFVNKPEEERGKILNIFGTSGVDEFNYSIHIVEAIGGIAGTGAISNKFVGRSEVDGKKCETFYVKFNSGIMAIYNSFHGLWQPSEIVIMTTKGTYRFGIDFSKVYGALLDRICDYMEKKINALAPVEAITESVKIMLAGRISREKGGIEVKLSDIPADDPGYDGDIFKKEYAAAAKKIYLA
jgi:Predicted dehydrogenases and related proteins